MPIESDVQGADGRLAVKFFKYLEKDEAATLVEGRPIFKEVDYIMINVPGDTLNERVRPVYDSDKTRFPIQWANYLNRIAEDGKYEGTPVTEWNLISRSQAEQLRAMKFYTVESIANASDQQIQTIGMAAGMSPYAFRDKAKNFLDSAKTEADFTQREEELAKLKEENARIKAETDAKLAKMQEQMATVLAAVGERKPRVKKLKEETTQE